MNKPIIILGATSTIARATAMAFAAKGHDLYLAGRDSDEIKRIANDLMIRYGITALPGNFDAEQFATHEAFFLKSLKECGELTGVIFACGYMVNGSAATDFNNAKKIIDVNFTGAVSILNYYANYFASRKQGFIIGISSVAGDRGRQSNYIYGSAKGALSLYLQGLRNQLYTFGVRVITIKPGFVDTQMTFGMPGLFLVASPEVIGKQIAASIHKNTDIIYLPWFWRYIMIIIRSIPEWIFKRLKL